MAHECPSCGRTCHCGGDIDDINFGEEYSCDCAYSAWGCGLEMDDADDDWDMEEEMYNQVKLNQSKDEKTEDKT